MATSTKRARGQQATSSRATSISSAAESSGLTEQVGNLFTSPSSFQEPKRHAAASDENGDRPTSNPGSPAVSASIVAPPPALDITDVATPQKQGNDMPGVVDVGTTSSRSERPKLTLTVPERKENAFAVPMTEPQTPMTSKDSKQSTDLHKAALEPNPVTIRNLLERVDAKSFHRCINAQEEHGFTALMSACALIKEIGLPCVEVLMRFHADPDIRDDCGFTALHWAAVAGNAAICDHLLNCKATVDLKAGEGDGMIDTALHRASRMGREEVIKVLQSHGADVWARNVEHKTAYEVAGVFSKKIDSKNQKKSRRALLEIVPSHSTLVLHHVACEQHLPPGIGAGHQESPHRTRLILTKLKSPRDFDAGELHLDDTFVPATLQQVGTVHCKDYVESVQDLALSLSVASPQAVPFTPHVQHRAGYSVTKSPTASDTFFSAGSLDAALYASGAVIHAVDQVVLGKHRNAFCATRPPGHHAGWGGLITGASSCGFCIFNHVMVAAMHALTQYPDKCQRVAIVDFDVHHGNGTEDCLQNLPPEIRRRIFFFSAHLYYSSNEYEFYPGTGAKDNMEMNFINAPIRPIWSVKTKGGRLPANSPHLSSQSAENSDGTEISPAPSSTSPTNRVGKREYRDAIIQRLIPTLRANQPDLILLSAGFDGGLGDVGNLHTGVGESGLDLDEKDFKWITEKIVGVANVCCNGRIVSCLEGGYGCMEKRTKDPVKEEKKLAALGGKKELSSWGALNRNKLADNCAAHVKALAGRY